MQKDIVIDIVNQYLNIFPEESQRQTKLIEYLQNNDDKQITDWNNFDGHIVAGGFIYAKEEKKFLVLYHKDLKMYLYPGGHADSDDINPLETSKREIKEELEFFKESGVIVRILNLPTTMIDYNQFDSKLQQTLMEMVNNILIEVLATMAETERDNIRKRQREGIDSAKRRGTKFGRPKKDFPASWRDDVLAWKTKKITAVALMRKYQIASSTFYKKVKEYEYQESCGKGYMTRGRM